MSKPKIKLEVGDIWGVLPVEKTLDMRTIKRGTCLTGCFLWYSTVGGDHIGIWHESFIRWIRSKKAVLIGHYDFKTGKAKGGKR